jgi:putative SOS response-associated peptidase YedK
MERRVKPLHDRMPIIIPEHNYDSGLKPDAERSPIDLLRPYNKAVGNVKNDTPELIDPASATSKQTEEPFRDGPGSLFT